ncbi:sensor histidine kinase [Massilibacteroides vaginae]|uniref:sensor histidine kinase n=1 Tax=Massilibacteroides vaginae TaxID=1673718 RepID=UPI000A1CE0E6|nr:HAMP domain-containing sensor histidine kinase [Massilibacteroides vaginae]
MKPNNKIIFLYTGVTIGVIMIAFILFSLVVSIRINTIHEQYVLSDKQIIEAIRKDVLTQIAWISVLFICVSGIPVYFISKRYAKRISERIDHAYESEKAFIRNASHEVNNPLTAIQGECEISLMKERTPTEYQNALRRIASETKRMILLMKHLLFLAHGEKEMLNNNTEPIQLANLLMEYAQGRVHFSMDNFALTIEANPQLLRMALDNLIGNACKYSEGLVYLDLRGTTLEIIDHGIGIPEKELENIYQPFYRASNTREFSGNGIGLSLAIRILNFYGAQVKIISKEKEGTRVSIDFQ